MPIQLNLRWEDSVDERRHNSAYRKLKKMSRDAIYTNIRITQENLTRTERRLARFYEHLLEDQVEHFETEINRYKERLKELDEQALELEMESWLKTE